jgi:hypothetical protein
MAKRIPEQDLAAIEAVVRDHPDGIGVDDIERLIGWEAPRRTLQYRLKYLVDENRLLREGAKRWAVYRTPTGDERRAVAPADTGEDAIPISAKGAEVQRYVRQRVERRTPVGYNRDFLESYRPNESAYFSEDERARLRQIGTPDGGGQPAGTYAKQIMGRLLIDLSWNSSRLEGNTYSLLDTRRLIAFGEEAEGREHLEAQMILNHKDAIEFLVGAADEIGFNRHTILNLHALLANNLLADPDATGRLRRIAVGIERSALHPLEGPQIIEECFDQLLASAVAIEDPFEQAFFVMAQLPYLQPFDDVNKRVSRLAANIPFIKANLTPLAFTDVPTKLYTDAMLGVYEMNEIDLLKDVFVWAYERSAARYAAVRQSLGEPDPFKLKHRAGLRQVIGEIVRNSMDKKSALRFIVGWATENVGPDEREKFRETAESEILGLHEGNFARYQIKPSEFFAWREAWR